VAAKISRRAGRNDLQRLVWRLTGLTSVTPSISGLRSRRRSRAATARWRTGPGWALVPSGKTTLGLIHSLTLSCVVAIVLESILRQSDLGRGFHTAKTLSDRNVVAAGLIGAAQSVA